MSTLTKGLLGLLCACLVALGIYFKGYHDSDQKHLKEAAETALVFRQKQEEERELSQRTLADISLQWQAYLAKKSEVAQGTIDRLRNDGVSLRVKLADATVRSVTSSGRPVPDGYADLSEGTSRFLIEQAQRCDAQVMGLQGVIKELQRSK
ncbi:hypothetical protein PflCFBP13517_18385 [Pseudomonas fluorescens]|nr:hypothetical protein PflCFBP13517_18385 [Pseudomonas fluorescens]